ncbi:hypothetical protein HK407_05g09130 [Ordospora pajunii]|uniref:uncharacterized protein n=1 Tax=Ordospora pajunii TaxID=3039483 RepID=UPI0029526CDC|nr:uncharacterized protein HK407_05g09130 [Ordospora pajunii]KAH9411395.1 hypothetical protein HK407_05g09130 [Ordospora pajunii]
MILVDGHELRRNSIIELCVLPDMMVHRIMAGIGRQVANAVFVDTVGNLRFVTDAIYVLSYRKLVKTLLSLRSRQGFVLFIDSMTFIADKQVSDAQKIYNVLWELVYGSDATVIVSNHYKVQQGKLVPRLGVRWEMMASYRVMFRHTKGNTVSSVHTNELFEQ